MKFLLSPPTSNGIIAFTRHATCRRALGNSSTTAYTTQHLQKRCMSGTYEAYAEAIHARKKQQSAKKPQWSGGASGTKHAGTRQNMNASRYDSAKFDVKETGEKDAVVSLEEEVPADEQDSELPPSLSFAALGFDATLLRALHTAFPNIQNPTRIQERLIPEILSGKDILLRDATGSGKTFGLMLAALNKPRMVLHEKNGSRRVITTLFIVPHKDLALQIMHWIERITGASKPAPPLPSIVQVLVRGSTTRPLEAAVKQLRNTPPHILVCTPQALMEVYGNDKDALQISTLSTVIVDEVDYLVETAARKEIGKSFMPAHEKRVRKLKMHPGPTREALDLIYAGRKELARLSHEREEDEDDEYESVGEWRNEKEAEEGHPQLVLSSATLRVHLKDYLFGESGWLNPYNIVKIMGATASAKKREKERVLHSILVVSDRNDVRNVEGAIAAPEEEIAAATAADVAVEVEDEIEEVDNRYYSEKYGRTPSPFNATALEAIATGFALDVPSIALLVIPSSAPVNRMVYELREMGVNAEALDVELSEKGKKYLLQKDMGVVRANPRLLVATLASTRGLDLPELSHAFILGVPEGPKVNGKSVDAYVHLAGRVGRFGRAGRVVTVLVNEPGGEAWRMERILGSIGERAVRFEHFD